MLGPGTTINERYVLLARLGGGGMGEVWRADDTVLARHVALKVMTPALSGNATFARRFQNEARAMATLRHPGVVDVYDYGACEVDGRPVSYLVMAFVEGEPLDRKLRRGPLTPEATMDLVAAVADALGAAHERGIVHRDVKPGNLIVKSDGSPVLVDFGISHTGSAQLTATGAMLCSAGYCAPELATDSEVTPSVDLYALGVVAYECLTGGLPFHGETPVQIIYKHLHAPVPPLPEEIPEAPRRVVLRALEKDRDWRWPSAPALARAAREARRTAEATGTAPDGIAAGRVTDGAAAGRVTGDGSVAGASAAGVTTGGFEAATVTQAGSGRGRRALLASVAMAAAVVVTAAVTASAMWMRPAPAEQIDPVVPGQTYTVTPPTKAVPLGEQREQLPPPKQSPKPHRGSSAPKPTQSVSATPTATTSATPTKDPTTPTAQPSTPGPEEPPTDEPPPVTDPPGDVQCVKSPCPG